MLRSFPECFFSFKSLESDLNSYEDSIREVTEEGATIIPHLDPEVADVFNKKLEEMNEQYARLSSQSKQFSEVRRRTHIFLLQLGTFLTCRCLRKSSALIRRLTTFRSGAKRSKNS